MENNAADELNVEVAEPNRTLRGLTDRRESFGYKFFQHPGLCFAQLLIGFLNLCLEFLPALDVGCRRLRPSRFKSITKLGRRLLKAFFKLLRLRPQLAVAELFVLGPQTINLVHVGAHPPDLAVVFSADNFFNNIQHSTSTAHLCRVARSTSTVARSPCKIHD